MLSQPGCYRSRLDVTVYAMNAVSTEEMDELREEHGIAWDRAASLQRLKDDKLIYPLNRIKYSDAETLIDIDSLGITNNKRVLAASVFGDVSGFTNYIDSAGDDDVKTALRVLHAIRKEMSAILRHDFSGVRVQFQGDRVQALLCRKAMKSASRFERSILRSHCNRRWNSSSRSCSPKRRNWAWL